VSGVEGGLEVRYRIYLGLLLKLAPPVRISFAPAVLVPIVVVLDSGHGWIRCAVARSRWLLPT
jgi:hypothetical protein